MRKIFPADLLARDGRFVRIQNEERFNDPRGQLGVAARDKSGRNPQRLTPDRPDAPDAARALDVVQPDVTKVGGISEERRIAWMAREHGIRFIPHGWNTAVGVAAAYGLPQEAVDAALARMVEVSRGEGNMIPAMLDACRAEATLGEICNALRDEWGEYREPARF